MLFVSILMLASASVAWFSMNDRATSNNSVINVGQSDSVSYTTPECKTSVIFPTKLFKSYKKDDVKKLIKAKNNN